MYTTRLTDKRQLTLSSDLLRTLHLKPGDTLELRPTPHGTLEVFPLRPDFDAVLETIFLGTLQGNLELESSPRPPQGNTLEVALIGVSGEES